MPRIIVTTDPYQVPRDTPVLLDEEVCSVHLSTHHAASQLLERLEWAIGDAEAAESTGADRQPSAPKRAQTVSQSARPGTGVPLGV
jgi:hypothetical protein